MSDMTFIGASMEHGRKLADAELIHADRSPTGRLPSANFPPFHTLPANSKSPLQRGALEVIAARPDAGRSLLVADIAKLEQRLIAAGVAAGADGAPTYCGVPIIENKFLPPDSVYIVTDSASTASLIAALSDVLPLMGKKP